jgi:uncharacterized membrane protein YoaK (UPF0700 family)
MRYAIRLAAGLTATGEFDEQALKRGATSLRHPLTRALLVLTFTTGLVDAVSYLGLRHVFTANMTGNVVLLGFGIAGGYGLPVVAPVVSVTAFLAGATAGGRLVKRTDRHHPALVTWAFGIEVGAVSVAAVVAAVTAIRPGNASGYVVIALLAGAMGVRNAAVRRIAVPDLTTTVLTMTLTGLAAESPLAGGSGQGSTRRIAAVIAMLAGALSGALLLKSALWAPLALIAVLELATWLVYLPAAVRLGR